MDEELKVIQNLGIATSKEVGEAIDKSIRNVIKGLNNLEVWGEIKIMIFQSSKHRKKLYLTNDIYNDLRKTKKPKR